MKMKRILIVDDLVSFQNIYKDVAEFLGFDFHLASSVETAKKLLEKYYYHVALIDLRLDDENDQNRDGLLVLNEIKKFDGTIPIMLTAYGGVKDADEAHRIYPGVLQQFSLKKDIPVKELEEAIQQAFKHSQEQMSKPLAIMELSKLIKGDTLTKFNNDFSITSEEVEIFLRRLLYPFRPLIPDQNKAEGYYIGGNNLTVRSRFWSKLLGSAIVVWFGAYEEMEVAIREMDKAETQRKIVGFGEKVSEVFDKFSFQNIGGAAYTLPDIDFESFTV
jgi:CheY-like chemotaxis protein